MSDLYSRMVAAGQLVPKHQGYCSLQVPHMTACSMHVAAMTHGIPMLASSSPKTADTAACRSLT